MEELMPGEVGGVCSDIGRGLYVGEVMGKVKERLLK